MEPTTFKDLKFGARFVLAREPHGKPFIKIYPIEDKFGNYFVAVRQDGYGYDTVDIRQDTPVEALL